MKAISIKNPWAYLIAAGLKDIENRTWQTHHRGKILIHASQKPDDRFREMSLLFTQQQWNALSLTERNRMACGIFDSSAIIGEVQISNCIQNSISVWAEKGQWHWVLKNPVLYKEPIRNVKGQLSIWEYENTIII